RGWSPRFEPRAPERRRPRLGRRGLRDALGSDRRGDGLREALARLDVEGVHVLRDRSHHDRVARIGVVAAVDARDDVDALAVELRVAVQVAVGAELLDDVDLDGQALARGRDGDVLGANAHDDLAARGV